MSPRPSPRLSPRRRADRGARAVAATVAAAATIAVLAGGCARLPGVYTYESAETVDRAEAGFDAVGYVEGIWSPRVLPTVDERAVDATVLLPALKADPAGAGSRYGRQAAAGGPYSYVVRGTGTVTEVGAAPSGPVTVAVTGADGNPYEVTIATGPVIAGTALRDAVGFIDFSQFTNQLDYAAVASQLNERVKTGVTGRIDKASLVGRQVTFAGAGAALGPNLASVVPTRLDVAA